MAQVEISRINQSGEIKVDGARPIVAPTLEHQATVFELPKKHGIIDLPEGNLSIRVNVNQNPARVVFAGDFGRRIVPMHDQGAQTTLAERFTAEMELGDNKKVIVRAPEALAEDLKRRRRAFERSRRRA